MISIVARERLSIFAVLSAMAIVVLDAGMINVALPSLSVALRIVPSQATLAVSAYQAALLAGLLPSAHLADRWGNRRMFVWGLALFSAASIACAFSDDLPQLIAARMVQGLGGSAIMALGIALLRAALGPERLGAAIGWNALTVALCSAAAPLLGASILSVLPWPWLFWSKLPIIALSLFASRVLSKDWLGQRSINAVGIAVHVSIVLAAAIAVGMLASSPFSAAFLALGATIIAILFVRSQRSNEKPLWPIDLLAQRPLRFAASASIFCFTAQSAGLVALPFYIQLGLERGPIAVGQVLVCWPVTVAITSIFANRLSERLGNFQLCSMGGFALCGGLLISALWPIQYSLVPLAAGAALCGLGFGLFQVPNNRTLFLSAPVERSAAAGGMQGSARLIGQTLGALLMGFLFANASSMIAPRIGFGVGALFALAAAIISVLALQRPSHDRLAEIRP